MARSKRLNTNPEAPTRPAVRRRTAEDHPPETITGDLNEPPPISDEHPMIPDTGSSKQESPRAVSSSKVADSSSSHFEDEARQAEEDERRLEEEFTLRMSAIRKRKEEVEMKRQEEERLRKEEEARLRKEEEDRQRVEKERTMMNSMKTPLQVYRKQPDDSLSASSNKAQLPRRSYGSPAKAHEPGHRIVLDVYSGP